MSVCKAKYDEGQYFMQKEKQKLFKIIDKNYVERLNKGSKSKIRYGEQEVYEWLYDIEYKKDGQIRRYYESRITNECSEISDQELAQAIYD